MEKIFVDECRVCAFFDCYEKGTCYDCGCNHPKAPKEIKNGLEAWCFREKEGFPEECPLLKKNGSVLVIAAKK